MDAKGYVMIPPYAEFNACVISTAKFGHANDAAAFNSSSSFLSWLPFTQRSISREDLSELKPVCTEPGGSPLTSSSSQQGIMGNWGFELSVT